MTTTEHEFDFHEGRHSETGSHVRVYYDYSNGKFATHDLITGRRSVADYAAVRRLSRYTIHETIRRDTIKIIFTRSEKLTHFSSVCPK